MMNTQKTQVTVQNGKNLVPPRMNARKAVAMGLCHNATVLRGHDWKWKDQDGGPGKTGVLRKIRGWRDEHENTRNAATVKWNQNHSENLYRICLEGKVDLKCTVAGSGGNYYPEHLPVLGIPYQTALQSIPENIQPGDFVKVKVALADFKKLQVGHGGWADEMSEAMNKFGKVTAVSDDSGDLRVKYPSSRSWPINRLSVTKVPTFSSGDKVRVIDDAVKVRNLQENHGEWTNQMTLILGQLGTVVKVLPVGDVRVNVMEQTWVCNPYCLIHEPGESLSDAAPIQSEGDRDLGIPGLAFEGDLLAFFEDPLLFGAASAGDARMVRNMLKKNPQKVNVKFQRKAVIHCASMGGHVEVLKVLFEFKADLDIGDEDEIPHCISVLMGDEVAKLLMNAGANVNSRNKKECTPLILAARKKKHNILKLFATHPKIQVDLQDSSGDTALHWTVFTRVIESVRILLDAKADPTISNAHNFTPIHTAAKKGFLLCMKEFISRFPQHINLVRQNGSTALHLAAINDHCGTLTILAQEGACNLNAKDNKEQTALHLAAYMCYPRIVESLVGYGAALNAQDSNGNTPLHFTLLKRTPVTFQPCEETPQLNKVCSDYHIPPSSGRAVVACFLVQEGADASICNGEGNTPLQKCTPDIADYVMAAEKEKGSASFHGSLRGMPLQQRPAQPMASAPKKDLKIEFSDLEFGEKVGSGGFGTVFRGRWISRGLEVAIKTLSGQIQKDEAEILSQLNHPNIIAFYGEAVGENSQYVIVTAFAKGGSLFDFIHTNKTHVGLEQKIQWAKEIAQGMKYLHQKEIVHRDLKSSNVLLTADLQTKICDFGAAKEFFHTAVQTAVGTVIWIAPEILKGEPSSLSCDVYSYGMVLYEIFTYKMPFEGVKTVFQIGALKENGEVPPIPGGCEPDFASLMKMCWKADPKARPSFLEIVATLDKKDVKIIYSDLEFSEKVGIGRFATVFKGHWKPKRLVVAIKRFSRQIEKEEVDVLSQLNHPNIIEFYGEAVGKNHQYVIVTAFAEGGSLYDFLHTKRTPVSHEQKVQWAKEIAQGMKYLHQWKFFHRGLKSSNILLTVDLATKICDVTTARENTHTMTSRAVIWMAPEVLSGDPVSMSSNLYSYGMVLYEIFTCKLPFHDVKTPFQIGALKLKGEVPPIPDGCPATFVRLMQMCWNTDPKARPSFHEVISHLDKKDIRINYSDLEFGEKIGGGSFGTVFKGHWKSKGLDVAIKRFSRIIEREEIEILNQLNHPHIIEFYGIAIGEHSHNVIVTAFAEGGSLYDFIHTNKTLVNHEQKVQWAKEIAEGMSYLHQKEIVHRDLKSCNVLLTADMATKICDFGAAKEAFHATVQTTTGEVTWLAPEVLQGEPSSLSCDVYSYGMVLYEIFTYTMPFHDIKTAFQIGALKLKGEVPAIPDSCEPSLANLMQVCWSSDPEARPDFHGIITILDKEVTVTEEHVLHHVDSQEPILAEVSGANDSTTDSHGSANGSMMSNHGGMINNTEHDVHHVTSQDQKPARVSSTDSSIITDIHSLNTSETDVMETSSSMTTDSCVNTRDTVLSSADDSMATDSQAKPLTLADLPSLKVKLQTVAGLWYPLGMELGIQPATLGGIPGVAGKDPSSCLHTVLKEWLETNDQSRIPTLEALAESVSNPIVGDKELAQSLLK